MDALPTIRQELERKTVEYLESKVHLAETNRLEKRDLTTIASALWNITSGLVDNSISTLCAEAQNAGQIPHIARRFVGKGKVLVILWNAHGRGFVGQSIDAATLHKNVFITSTAEVGEREEDLKKLFGVLSKSGYLEIN